MSRIASGFPAKVRSSILWGRDRQVYVIIEARRHGQLAKRVGSAGAK
jgi:hypothetical protein